MKTRISLANVLVLLVCVALFSGCATAPSKNAYSIPAPVEVEKKRVDNRPIEYVYVLDMLMPVQLLVEKPVRSTSSWPIDALRRDGQTVDEGEAFNTGRDQFMSWVMKAQFENVSAQDHEGATYILFSRHKSKAYGRSGEIPGYDKGKYAKDLGYKRQLHRQQGLTKESIVQMWSDYAASFFMPIRNVQVEHEYRVGSQEWESYKSQLKQLMPEDYKLRDGEIRWGTTPLKEFQTNAVKNPGDTWWMRYRKNLSIGGGAFDPSGFGAASTLLAPAMAATINRTPQGYYQESSCTRGDMEGLVIEIQGYAQQAFQEAHQREVFMEAMLGQLIEMKLITPGQAQAAAQRAKQSLGIR